MTIIFFGALGGGLGFRLTESSNEWEIKTNKHVKQNAAINEALDELSHPRQILMTALKCVLR